MACRSIVYRILQAAVEDRRFVPKYTAIRFTQRLANAGIAASTGSVGDSHDNALAENFFSALKVELVYRTSFRTREQSELSGDLDVLTVVGSGPAVRCP
jgi:transposase InsO family protein